MSKFIQIIIQEKSSNEDYRSFCICEDDDGHNWELRGYGSSVEAAAKDAIDKYNDEDWWHLYGVIVELCYNKTS